MEMTTTSTSSIQTSLFMSKVYQWMSVGVLITGFIAYYVGNTEELINAILANPFVIWMLFIAQFAIVIGLASRVDRISIGNAKFLFLLYSALTGITFSTLFVVYSLDSIQSAFFTSAAAFASLSIYGYVTKRDLGPVASFCMMGLFGLIAYALFSLFFPVLMGGSAGLTYSIVGLIIFSGLTAYDSQRIKAMGQETTSADQAKKVGILGALTLYLDFINLFLLFLQFSNNRRRRWG